MNDTMALLPDIKLRFNIKHPSYEETYMFGYECAISEVSEEDNPFAEGSQEHDHWLEGWWAGIYGEPALFESAVLESENSDEIIPTVAANDTRYSQKHSFMTLVFEISGAIVASAAVGYQLLELVA